MTIKLASHNLLFRITWRARGIKHFSLSAILSIVITLQIVKWEHLVQNSVGNAITFLILHQISSQIFLLLFSFIFFRKHWYLYQQGLMNRYYTISLLLNNSGMQLRSNDTWNVFGSQRAWHNCKKNYNNNNNLKSIAEDRVPQSVM